MLELNTRIQIAAIFIFSIVLVNFLRKKKLPLLSVKRFTVILIFTAINLLFDVLTVYSLVNYECMPKWLNRLFHQIFIGSLDCIVFFLFLYVDALCKKEKRIRINDVRMLKLLPFIISMVVVVFGRLDYEYTDKIYSYGPMAYTIYVSVGVYMFLSIFELIKYRKSLSSENLVAISAGIGLWITITVVQMIFPQLLLSSIALVGMVIILYFAFENPKEHIEEGTDSFNRSAFLLVTSEAINSKKHYMIVSIVIEDYYMINSTYGYEKGNMVLASISKYLKNTCSKYIFHIGGNALSFLSYDFDNHDTIIKGITSFLNYPIEINKKENVEQIPIIAHIDVVQKEKIEPENINRIMTIIDFMSEKKYGGETNSRVMYFDSSIIHEEARKQQILEIVKNALENDGFEIVYQPIFDVRKKKFTSAEALVRIKDDKTIGYISPEEFIPIIEKYGLMNELGDIIFRLICHFISNNDLGNKGIEYIEVNLSAIQCVDVELPSRLEKILKEYNVNSSFINLEITETSVITSNENLDINMRELRKIGCSFSMDDFGTGYSNLSKVAEVQYDIIKLDKSLIWPCFEHIKNEKAMSILDNITKMLFDLDQEIVAEGVETKEQFDYLVSHYVMHIQGYYFSRPLKEEKYLEFIM